MNKHETVLRVAWLRRKFYYALRTLYRYSKRGISLNLTPIKQLALLIAAVALIVSGVITLVSLIPAVHQLNQDAASVHQEATEENKRKFDVSLEKVKTITEGVGTLATIIAGIVLYLNFKITEDKQVAERFSKAIEQLGNTNQLSVRLGGIYSLERIAKDSPEDLWPIVEVLSSLIQEYSTTSTRNLQNQLAKEGRHKLPTDVEAAFTAIDRIYTRRTTKNSVNLRGINLSNTDLLITNFRYFDLYNSNFSGSSLSYADFRNSFLVDANLSHSMLSGADFNGSTLIDANLKNADLRGAKLSHTNLGGANLIAANLDGAKLDRACLINTNLSDAHLSNVNFSNAIAWNTNFDNAILSNASFQDADLRNVSFQGADLSNTNFQGALLLGADLSGKELKSEQLTGSSPPFLCATKLPDGLDKKLSNRDCNQLQTLLKMLPGYTLQDAKSLVEEAQEHQW
jgi:uncharacterized protein YjbI with pentapeptide repeats